MSQRVEQLTAIQEEARGLFEKKNKDYGDAFATYGPVGVIVRMGDKINRLTTISKKGIMLVNNESLRDTLIDLHNYSAMAIMLLDETPEHPRVNTLRKNAKNVSVPTSIHTIAQSNESHFGYRAWKRNREDIC